MPYLLAYISRSTLKSPASVLDEIAQRSAEKNAELDVTGILLLNGNYFFQVLEGREDRVRSLFATIEEDPRHHETRIVLECEAEQRLFESWFMRGINLNAYYDVDFSEFRRQFNAAVGERMSNKNDVITLLRSFKNLITTADISQRYEQ